MQLGTDGAATFTGQARVNGVAGFRFTVVVRDDGEPRRGTDSFQILIEGPAGFDYDSNDFNSDGGLLRGGNIQFRFPTNKPS